MYYFEKIQGENSHEENMTAWLSDAAQNGIYELDFQIIDNAVYVKYRKNI